MKSIKDTQTHLELELHDGTKVKTELLIGADGQNSKVREYSHIDAWELKQDILGLMFIVKTDQVYRSGLMRFLQTGPVMLLPLWGSYMSVMWNLPSHMAKRMKSLSHEQLLDELNEALKHAPMVKNFWGNAKIDLPRLTAIVSEVETDPHTIMHSRSFIGNKTALIGDAAHSLYPLLGQSTNAGMYDAINLATGIIEAAKLAKSISSEDCLKNYHRKAYLYNASAACFEQSLKFVYSDYRLLHHARNFGFGFLNMLGPLKSFSVSLANGEYVVPRSWPWVSSIPKDDAPFSGNK